MSEEPVVGVGPVALVCRVAKRWKLSPMDLEARNRWVEFSKAKDAMFARTDIPEAPWWVVEAEVKKRARLNVIPAKESQNVVPDVVP